MGRHQFDSEDRDGVVAELAEQRVRSWVRLLLAGDKRAMNDLQNMVLDRLSEEDAKALFVQAATQDDADISFTLTVRNLMRDHCVAKAEDTADAMERARAASHDDNLIAQVECDRALH